MQDAEALAKIACESVAQTVHKQGCLYYIASFDLNQPNVFQLSEGRASQADLEAHEASASFQNMLEQAFKPRILKRGIHLSESKNRKLLP